MVSPTTEDVVLFSLERKRRAPVSVISPSSSIASSQAPVIQVTPSRRALFQPTPRASRPSQGEESRDPSEVHELKRSNQKKERQLRVLHERFSHIQKGLGSIDQERAMLMEKSQKLEDEKKQIEEQLEVREREILALVRRCASQEEKMKETSQLRAQNRELAKALESVQGRVQGYEDKQGDLHSLRKELQESELAREELQDRYRQIQREHDSIADTLQGCLATVTQLTEEKQLIEEERRREKKRAEIEMQKQQLVHLETANSLREDMEAQRQKIDQMERILQQNMHSKTSLRKENAAKHEAIQIAAQQYENKIDELETRLSESVKAKEAHYESMLVHLKEKVYEKQAVVTDLETEFSGQMRELMRKQTSLDEAQQENETLTSQIQRLESLEPENSALLEYVDILESNLAELTSENAHLVLERDSLKELQMGSEVSHGDSAQLQKRIDVSKAEIQLLEADLEIRDDWVTKLEDELKESRRLIVLKDQEIGRIEVEKKELATIVEEEQKETTGNEPMPRTMEESANHSSRALVEDSREPVSDSEDDRGDARLGSGVSVQSLRNKIYELEGKCSTFEDDALEARRALAEEVARAEALSEELDGANRELRNQTGKLSSLEHVNSDLQREAELGQQAMEREHMQMEEMKQLSKTKEGLEMELSLARQQLEDGAIQATQLVSESQMLRTEKEEALQRVEESKGKIEQMENDLASRSTGESQMSHQIASLTAEVANLKHTNGSLEESLTAADEQVESLVLRTASQFEKLSSFEGELAQSQQAVRQAEEQLKTAEAEKSKLTKEMEERTDAMTAKYNKVVQGHEDALASLCSSQARSKELEEELGQERMISAKKVTDLESQCSDALEQVSLLENKLESCNDRIKDLDKTKNELVVLESRLAITQETEEGLKKDLGNAESRISHLEAECCKKELELEEAVSSETEGKARLEHAFSEAKANVTLLAGEKHVLEERCSELERKITDNDEVAKAALSDFLLKHEASQRELSNKQARIESLEQTKDAMDEQKVALDLLVSDAHSEITRLEKELESQHAQIESLHLGVQDVEGMEAELARAKSSSVMFERELQEVRSMFDGRGKELMETEAKLKDEVATHTSEKKSLNEILENERARTHHAEDESRKLRELLASMEQELQETLDSSQQRYKDLESQHTSTLESLSAAEAQLEEADLQIRLVEEKKTDLECRLTETENRVELMGQELESRDERIKTLSHDAEQLDRVKAEKAELGMLLEEARHDASLSAGDVDKKELLHREEVSALTERISTLEHLLDEEKERAGLNPDKEGELNAKCSALVAELCQLRETSHESYMSILKQYNDASESSQRKDVQIEELEEERDEAVQRCAVLDEIAKETQDSATSLSKERQARDEKILDLEGKLESLQTKENELLGVVERKAELAMNQLERTNTEKAELEVLLEEARRDAADAASKVDEQKGSHLEEVSTLLEKISTLEEHLIEEDGRARQLSEKEDELKDRCSLLEAELHEEREASTLKYRRLAKEHTEALESSELKEMRIEALEVERDEAVQRCSILDESVTEAQQSIRSLSNAQQSRDEKIHSLEGRVSHLQNKETELVEVMEKNSELEMRVEAAQEKQCALEEDIQKYEVQLQESASSADEQLASLNQRLSEQVERLSLVEEQRNDLAGKCSLLEEDLASTRRMANERQQELTKLKEEASVTLGSMEGQLKTLQSEIEVSSKEKHAMGLHMTEMEEKIARLDQGLGTRDDQISQLTLELTVNQERQGELKEQEGDLKQKLKESTESCENLSKKLAEVDSLLTKANKQIVQVETLESNARKQTDEVLKKCSELETVVESLQRQRDNQQAQLLDAGNDREVARTSLVQKERQIEELEASKASLTASLEDAKKATCRIEQVRDEELREERETNKATRKELERFKSEVLQERDLVSELEAMLQKQDNDMVAIQKELDQAIQAMNGSEESSKRRITILENQLLKMETDVALKDDEIRELRIIELKEKEEAIATLSDELENFKLEMQARENEAIASVEEFHSEALRWKTKAEEFEVFVVQSEEEHSTEVRMLEARLEDVEEAKKKAEAKFQDLQGNVAEHEQQVEKLHKALDVALARGSEEIESERQEQERLREKEASEYKVKLKQTESKLAETSMVLQDRTSLLSSMVEHNKELESILEKRVGELEGLGEETIRNQRELLETKKELRQVQEERNQQETKLTLELEEEKSRRDGAESELARLRVQYKEASNAKKQISELATANKALKDKVERQEAYLQRKLKKEKEQRNRASPAL